MRPPHHILDRNRVHRLAAEHLQAHLHFRDYKKKTSAPVLWALLLAAAARITSLSDACWPPCPTTPPCNNSSMPPWPGTCPRCCAPTSSASPST
jgi:hypothetical protein